MPSDRDAKPADVVSSCHRLRLPGCLAETLNAVSMDVHADVEHIWTDIEQQNDRKG